MTKTTKRIAAFVAAVLVAIASIFAIFGARPKSVYALSSDYIAGTNMSTVYYFTDYYPTYSSEDLLTSGDMLVDYSSYTVIYDREIIDSSTFDIMDLD